MDGDWPSLFIHLANHVRKFFNGKKILKKIYIKFLQFFRSFWLWVTKTDEKSFIIRGSAMMLRYSINKPCPFIKAQCCKIRKKCNLWKVTLQLFARPQGFFEIFSHDMSLKGMENFFSKKRCGSFFLHYFSNIRSL